VPYKNVSELPSNVPAKYAKQFLEVWNSVYASAKEDKKSDADAEATAFTQSWGVINKQKEKDKRDVAVDGPGFSAGVAEKKNEDGGQVSDPTMSLRFSEDQARDPDGKFASGTSTSHKPDEQAKSKGTERVKDNQGRAPGVVDANDKSIEHVQTLAEHMNEFQKEGNVDAWAAFKTASNVIGGLKVSKSLAEKTFNTLAEHNNEAIKEGNSHLVHALTDAMAKLNNMRRFPSQIAETRETYMSIEKRYAAELRVGAALGGNSGGDEMAIEGYAARFNQQSKDLGGFRETVAPGAFTKALAGNPDVRCLFNHDANRVLGRTSAGTLTLTQDEHGLKFRCQLDPNNQEHRNLHSSIKRGDINECSFAFMPDKQSDGSDGDVWQDAKDERGNWFISRTLKNVRLFDVSAVTHPAYEGTNVDARAEFVTPEIRSIMNKIISKRALGNPDLESGKDSLEDYCSEVCKTLCEKFPADDESKNGGYCGPFGGKYYVCETYTDHVIASECGTGEYVSIPYIEDGSDNYVFGTPVPVEKTWTPSERSKSIQGETRALKAAHMQKIADEHAKTAADHTATAAGHTAAADAHADEAAAHQNAADAAQKEADRMKKCEESDGDCETKSCRCQNCMRKEHEVYYGDDENEPEQGDDDDMRSLKAARRVMLRSAFGIVETRDGDGNVRTKTVGGKSLSASSFAYVGDPNDTSTWKYPVHDADHARNALARWGQHKGIPADKEAGAYAKIVAAAKKFGIEVSETNADAAARMSDEEREELELRFKLAILSTEVRS